MFGLMVWIVESILIMMGKNMINIVMMILG